MERLDARKLALKCGTDKSVSSEAIKRSGAEDLKRNMQQAVKKLHEVAAKMENNEQEDPCD